MLSERDIIRAADRAAAAGGAGAHSRGAPSVAGLTIPRDSVLLLYRLLMVLLFVIFGWQKLVGYDETVAEFVHNGVPLPFIAVPVAIMMELGVGIAVALGFFTRPLAILSGIYTLGTAFVGHPFWAMSGADYVHAEIDFFKNVSIMGGLFVLGITGAGRFSLDAKFNLD